MIKLSNYGIKSKNDFFHIIAEIGINHGGNLDTAKKLIDSASRAGVDSVKFQTYRTEKRVPKDSPIYDILRDCELPMDSFEVLKNHALEQGVQFFSTPFDLKSVDLLADLDVDMFKIASFDSVNHKLIERASKKKKTTIISLGMSNANEIKDAFTIADKHSKQVVLMHCISSYPTSNENANLMVINYLKNNYDCLVGQSDHTNDIKVPLYAMANGAQMIEKHFKIDDQMNCVDSPVSITESQMRSLVNETKELEKIFGDGFLGVRPSEEGIVPFRRFSEVE